MRRPVLLTAIVAALACAPAAEAADTALNIVPWGQTEPGASWTSAPGILPPETQALMYDRLTPLFRDVTDTTLTPSTDGTGYFKPEVLRPEDDPAFVTAETVTGSVPGRTGTLSARVRRDAYGVPHVYSDTDDGVIFGAGWVLGEDRALLLAAARKDTYAAAIDLPGVSASTLILGSGNFEPSKATVDEVTRTQTRALEKGGASGRQVLHDIDTFIAGLNTWFAAKQPTTAPFTRADMYAVNAFKGQFLGEGGGSETENALALATFQDQLGTTRGREAYEDLRQRTDPESYTSTRRRFATATKVKVKGAKGRVPLVEDSFSSAGPKLPRAVSAPRREASNALLVRGDRAQGGVPIMVAGPQLPYTFPGFTNEIGLYGPSIRSVGVTSAPFPGYMLIGRGTDFAWSLTSAGVDIVDTYAETLCGGSRTRYRYKGKCRTMKTLDAGTITQGSTSVAVKVRRTVHGTVIGYARDARTHRLVALSRKRSSFGRDVLDQRFFQKLTFGKVHTAKQFIAAAASTPQTFNSFFVSHDEIAMVTTGRFPVRAKGVNPDLPVDGRGKYEWKGTLPISKHPQVVNPSTGVIVNWNNKPARGWPAGDDRWSEGSIQRAQLLADELDRTKVNTPATVTAAMNAGATEDVRIVELWPTLKAVLDRGTAPSARATAMVAQLQAWHDAGGTRLDRDLDGKIDAAGAAILDAAWSRISSAALCKRLGDDACAALETRMSRFDTPPGGQYSGWHQYLQKDLRSLLGRDVAGAFKLRYCGRGSVSRCAKDLWAALDTTGAELAATQGEDPAAWRKPAERISFAPLPLITMRYTNRPSGIQQVIRFEGASG